MNVYDIIQNVETLEFFVIVAKPYDGSWQIRRIDDDRTPGTAKYNVPKAKQDEYVYCPGWTYTENGAFRDYELIALRLGLSLADKTFGADDEA